MKIISNKTKTIIDGQHDLILRKNECYGVQVDKDKEYELEVKNIYMLGGCSKSFKQKLKTTIEVLKYIWR